MEGKRIHNAPDVALSPMKLPARSLRGLNSASGEIVKGCNRGFGFLGGLPRDCGTARGKTDVSAQTCSLGSLPGPSSQSVCITIIRVHFCL